MNIIEIATEIIDEDTAQPRYQFDEEALEELMKSIEELGLLSPIKVRKTDNGRYKIIYGNRRYKACKMLGRKTIPCIVSTVTDEMEIYLEQIAENLTREGFSPIEEAEAFDKLLNDPKFRSSTKFLSGKLGKPESYIKNKCELLKFGNAVKKLIVSGTEIRKDKLTEDQLLPLKDLPLEHRDPLALIVARDELPVSDVKKIAKLFKDKSISAATKDKLLFKTGSGLIETWSTHEQNKAERAKPAAEAKPAAKASKKAEMQEQGAVHGHTVAHGESAMQGQATAQGDLTAAHGQTAAEGDQPAAQGQLTVEQQLTNQPSASAAAAPIQLMLQQLSSVLPVHVSLPAHLLQSVEAISAAEQDSFARGVDALIDSLEKHLSNWKAVRELANSKSNAAASVE